MINQSSKCTGENLNNVQVCVIITKIVPVPEIFITHCYSVRKNIDIYFPVQLHPKNRIVKTCGDELTQGLS